VPSWKYIIVLLVAKLIVIVLVLFLIRTTSDARYIVLVHEFWQKIAGVAIDDILLRIRRDRLDLPTRHRWHERGFLRIDG